MKRLILVITKIFKKYTTKHKKDLNNIYNSACGLHYGDRYGNGWGFGISGNIQGDGFGCGYENRYGDGYGDGFGFGRGNGYWYGYGYGWGDSSTSIYYNDRIKSYNTNLIIKTKK